MGEIAWQTEIGVIQRLPMSYRLPSCLFRSPGHNSPTQRQRRIHTGPTPSVTSRTVVPLSASTWLGAREQFALVAAATPVPSQGPGFIATAYSGVSGMALFLDANGGVFQSPLTGGALTRVASLPGAIVDAGGDILVVDSTGNTINRIDAAGNQSTLATFSAQQGRVTGLAIDGLANIFYTTTNPAGAFEFHAIQNFEPLLTAAVGSTSAPGDYSVTNAGNQPLSFSGIAVPAPFAFTPADAPNGTAACSTTTPVVAGTDCQVPVVFTPVAAGPANALATLTDNSLNNALSTQTFSVQGTGTGVTPTSLALTGPTTGVAGQTGTYTVIESGAGGATATGDSNIVGVSIVGPSSMVNISVTLANGVGTFTVPLTAHAPEGNTDYTITATDGVNSNLTAQLSLVVTQPLATRLALAVNPAAPTTADPVSVVVTLGGDQALQPATGAISYTLDGVAGAISIQVGVQNSPGAYIVAVPLGRLAAGPHSFVATYSGDANYLPALRGCRLASPHWLRRLLRWRSPSPETWLVASGTAVTLTGTVTVNGDFVSPGLVTFCDATAAGCENSALLGTAQLKTAGTATLKFIPGIGSHSYKAVFTGTNGEAGSTSTAQPLMVTGLYPTATTIQATGSQGPLHVDRDGGRDG
jgi:hypothetical protein